MDTRIKDNSSDRDFMTRLSHTTGPLTVGEAIDACARAFAKARLYFGHGTDNARDEAAELVFFAAALQHSLGDKAYGRTLNARATRQN